MPFSAQTKTNNSLDHLYTISIRYTLCSKTHQLTIKIKLSYKYKTKIRTQKEKKRKKEKANTFSSRPRLAKTEQDHMHHTKFDSLPITPITPINKYPNKPHSKIFKKIKAKPIRIKEKE